MQIQNRVFLLFSLFFFLLVFQNCEESNKKITKDTQIELVWSDEFDYEGLPNPDKWSYDVGDGCPDICGWGNNELEYYKANSLKNSRVENGVLTIEAHKEGFKNKSFTSASRCK